MASVLMRPRMLTACGKIVAGESNLNISELRAYNCGVVETLFGQLELPPAPPPHAKAEGPFAAVALEQGIDRLLDFSIPAKLRNPLHVGQGVLVRLGLNNRKTRGYVISIHEETTSQQPKPLAGNEDE